MERKISYYQSQPEGSINFTENQNWIVVGPSLEWQGQLDEQLKSLVTKSSQAVEELDFEGMVGQFRAIAQQFPDNRTGQNSIYQMEDAALSAFSVFFMQSASFLEYQKRMEQNKGRSNMQSLFGAHKIPSNNQTRNLLDGVAPLHSTPIL